MRKTAGFLKFVATFALVFMGIAVLGLALSIVGLLAIGDITELAEKMGQAVTITNHANVTPAEINAMKPFLIVGLAIGLVSVIFAIIGTLKTRKVLEECKQERPFSDESINNLLASARIEVIGGVIGIIGGVVLSVMAKGLTFGGTSVASTSTTYSLTFIIYAVMKYLLYHVAEYGKKLEQR